MSKTTVNTQPELQTIINSQENPKVTEKKRESHTKIHTSLKFITLVRCTYAILVLIYCSLWIFASYHQADNANTKLILGSVIEIFIFTGICCIFLLKNRFIKPITYISMGHDAALAAFIVVMTGYHASPFLYLFLIIPLYGGISLQRRGGLFGATVVSLMLFILYHGLPSFLHSLPNALQDTLISMMPTRRDVSNRLLSLGLAAYGVGFLTGQLAHQYVRVQANLIETDREFSHIRGIYEIMLNALPIGVIITSPTHGQSIYSNPAARKLVPELLENNEKNIEQQLLPDAHAALQIQNDWICPYKNSYLRIAKFELPIESQQPLPGFYISDVTEQQLANIERAKRQRLELLGEFSAKVAHEIRNPLACISGCNEMLQSEIQDEEQLQMVNMMGDEIDRLNSLLNDILVFSRRPKLNFKLLHLLSLLEHQRDIFLSDKNNANIQINIDLDPEMTFYMDENSFCQIVMTLWRNSAEATEGKGIFTVRANENQQEIDFSDDGPGLSAEAVHRVFEPFFTTKPTGTGLGLSIARQFADDNGFSLGWNMDERCFYLRYTPNPGELSSEILQAIVA